MKKIPPKKCQIFSFWIFFSVQKYEKKIPICVVKMESYFFSFSFNTEKSKIHLYKEPHSSLMNFNMVVVPTLKTYS